VQRGRIKVSRPIPFAAIAAKAVSRSPALVLISIFCLIPSTELRSGASEAGAAGISIGGSQQPARQKPKTDEDEPLQLHSDLVVVSVTVTNPAGEYAHGLKAADFAVREDNATQKIDTFSADEAPFAAAVLIDMSGSMERKFGLARAAAASFLDHIREDDQVAVYGFNNEVRRFQDFTSVRDISDYVWDASARDNTRLYDCVSEAAEALAAREEKRRAIVLISDGCDTVSRKASMESALKRVHAAGITMYSIDLIEDNALTGSSSVAIELRRGRGELKQFATETGGRYVYSPQGDKLEEAFAKIVDELRNQYTLTYYSSNRKRDGRWRKISIGVTRQGLSTRTRTGYWAPRRAGG
jgi:VWFA-related protein